MRWRPVSEIKDRRQLFTGLAAWGVLLISWFIHAPGMDSAYVLDDATVLQTLSIIESQDDLDEMLNYILAGHTGPSGRPLSSLTYALQFDAWPSNPQAFHRIDILLHLLAGCLLFLFLGRLGAMGAGLSRQKSSLIALIVMAAWLLHPLNVSTTLYIAQRMTQLVTVFTLVGLISWLVARERWVNQGKVMAAAPWLLVALPGALLLAALSKESAINAFIFILVIEWFLLPRQVPDAWRWTRRALVLLPLLVAAGFLALKLPEFAQTYASRDFTLAERLMTEARVLWDYLFMLLVPVPSNLSVYHDGFAISRSLLSPLTTLPAILGLVGVIIAAIHFRRRAPLFIFAVAWFLGGHLLESTALPLEIYFEHRNYLPMVGPLFAIAVAVAQGASRSHEQRKLALALPLILLPTFAYITYSEVRLWADPVQRAETWAERHPESARAQGMHAIMLHSTGNYSGLRKHLGEMMAQFDDAGPIVMWLNLACNDKALPLPREDILAQVLRETRYFHSPQIVLDKLLAAHEQKKESCQRISLAYLRTYIEALMANPAFDRQKRIIHHVHLARLLRLEGRIDEALEVMNSMEGEKPVDATLMQAIWLAEHCRPEEARRYVDEAREILEKDVLKGMAYEERADWTLEIIARHQSTCEELRQAHETPGPGG